MSFNSDCASSYSGGRRQREDAYGGNYVQCLCVIEGKRLRAPRMTSWTEDNPGRRFYGCRNWKSKNCGFFEWHDEPMCERSREVIKSLKTENGELRKILERATTMDMDLEALKNENVELRKMVKESMTVRRKNAFLWIILIVSWLLVLFIVVG